MTRYKRCPELVEGLSITILLALTLLLIGQAAYAQGETQTANLQIEGMV